MQQIRPGPGENRGCHPFSAGRRRQGNRRQRGGQVHLARDLRVILTAPGREEVVLQERSGRAQDDLIRSYRSTDEPDLFAPVLGASAQGDWGLRVLDMAEQDVGVLVKWGLAITY